VSTFVVRRVLPGALVLAIVIAVAGGAGNAYAFQRRAASLEQRWKEMEAVGVPASELAPMRSQLTAMEGRHTGPMPYPALSMALVGDPLRALEGRTDARYGQVTARFRARAKAALDHLAQVAAPTPFDAGTHSRQLASARTPGDLQRLEQRWRAQAARLDQVKAQLAARAGGLQGGLPADVVGGRDQLQQAAAGAGKQGLWTDPAASTLTAVNTYLAGGYPAMLSGHDAIAGQLQQANGALAHRLDLKSKADGLVGGMPDLLRYAPNGDYGTRFDKAKHDLGAARDDRALEGAETELQSVANDLWQMRQRFQAGAQGCPAGPGKLIVISLGEQRLLACQDGAPVLSTYVTTGRPALPTPTGTTQIFYKSARYWMSPSCPAGSWCWYQPTWVSDAMEFRGGGYFIHSWPQDEYGPGSQYGPQASHGCVHVPIDSLQQLFDWASIGTTVSVVD
jgi:lipoprotein-anchoring transpeptidase ErfK/SrfK